MTKQTAVEPPEPELLPCMRCRGGAEVFPEESDDGYYVMCAQPKFPFTECWLSLGEEYDRDAMPVHRFRTKEDAIEAWNTRAGSRDVWDGKDLARRIFEYCDSVKWGQGRAMMTEMDMEEIVREWAKSASTLATTTDFQLGYEQAREDAAKACEKRRLEMIKKVRNAVEKGDSNLPYFDGKECATAECAVIIRALAPPPAVAQRPVGEEKQ